MTRGRPLHGRAIAATLLALAGAGALFALRPDLDLAAAAFFFRDGRFPELAGLRAAFYWLPAGLLAFVQDGSSFTSGSSGIPTEFNIALANTSGLNFDTALNFNNKGVLTVPVIRASGYADSAARDAAITSPTGGMIVYLQDSGVFCGYNAVSETWVTLG